MANHGPTIPFSPDLLLVTTYLLSRTDEHLPTDQESRLVLLVTGERTIDLGEGIIGFVAAFTPCAIALLERKVPSVPFIEIGTNCPGSDVDLLSCVSFPRIFRSGKLSLWSTSSPPHTLIHDHLQCNTPSLQQVPTSL